MWNVHNMHFMIWYITDVYSQSSSIEEKIKSKTRILLILLIATCIVATESLCLHEALVLLSLDQSKQSGRIAQMGNVMPN